MNRLSTKHFIGLEHATINDINLIIDDDDATIFNWFNSENGFPSTVFIDQDMTVQYKANYINNYYMKC